VVPDRVQYATGTAGNATAIGFFSDGSHADLTSLVKWTSSAPSVLSVSTASGSWGRLSALGPGVVLLQASYLEVTGSASVTVSSATLTGLGISPLEPHGVQGTDLALEATGAFSDGSAQPMTRSVQWSVDDQSVGYFSSPGVVTLLSAGTTTVRAVASNQQAAAELTVSPESPIQLEISPALPDAIQINGTARLSAWLTHQDGTAVLTAPAWSSVDRTVDVSPIGEVTAVQQPGVGTLIASEGSLEARASIEATVDAIVAWQVWPPELVVPVGAEGSLVFERILNGGIVQDLTQVAGWRSQGADTGIDVDTGERGGTVRTREPGSRLSVVGIISGAVARAWVRAPAGAPTLEIVPPSGTVPAGGRTRVAAVGHWPDGTVVEVTSATSWSGSPEGVITPGDGPSAGLVLGSRDAGVATLRARFGSATAQAQLQVEPGPPVLEIWPPVAGLASNTALPVSVTLLTASGDSTDVTTDAVWRSSEPRVAMVTNAPDQRGTLLAQAPGSAVLTARVDGVQASFLVNVTEATLQEIALHPPDTIVTWAPSTFGASGTFSDGTVQDLTHWVTWAPQDPSLLRIRGTGPDRGIARGVDAGTVQVHAHPLGGEARNVLVTVTGAPPSSLALELPAGAVAVGTRPRVRAIARAPDGTNVDVTAQAEWISSDPALATVSSVVRPGSVRALRTGTPTLIARFAGLTTGAPLPITAGTLTRLSVTAPGALSVGTSATASATATLSSGGTQVLAEDVVWSSDDPDILAVSNAPAGRGRLLAIHPGTTTLRVRTRPGLPVLQASAAVTVSGPALRSSPAGALRHAGTRTHPPASR